MTQRLKLKLTPKEAKEAQKQWLAWEIATTQCAMAGIRGPEAADEYMAAGQRAHAAISRIREIYGVARAAVGGPRAN